MCISYFCPNIQGLYTRSVYKVCIQGVKKMDILNKIKDVLQKKIMLVKLNFFQHPVDQAQALASLTFFVELQSNSHGFVSVSLELD